MDDNWWRRRRWRGSGRGAATATTTKGCPLPPRRHGARSVRRRQLHANRRGRGGEETGGRAAAAAFRSVGRHVAHRGVCVRAAAAPAARRRRRLARVRACAGRTTADGDACPWTRPPGAYLRCVTSYMPARACVRLRRRRARYNVVVPRRPNATPARRANQFARPSAPRPPVARTRQPRRRPTRHRCTRRH